VLLLPSGAMGLPSGAPWSAAPGLPRGRSLLAPSCVGEPRSWALRGPLFLRVSACACPVLSFSVCIGIASCLSPSIVSVGTSVCIVYHTKVL
jgi:hypothetical protein